AQPIVPRRQQHVRQNRHGLPALDHADNALQGFEQMLARRGDFHVPGFLLGAKGLCSSTGSLNEYSFLEKPMMNTKPVESVNDSAFVGLYTANTAVARQRPIRR